MMEVMVKSFRDSMLNTSEVIAANIIEKGCIRDAKVILMRKIITKNGRMPWKFGRIN